MSAKSPASATPRRRRPGEREAVVTRFVIKISNADRLGNMFQGGLDKQANGGGGERTDAFGDELWMRPSEDRPPLHHLRRLLPGLQHPRGKGVWSWHLCLQVGSSASSVKCPAGLFRLTPASLLQAGPRRPRRAEWNKDGGPDPGCQRGEL